VLGAGDVESDLGAELVGAGEFFLFAEALPEVDFDLGGSWAGFARSSRRAHGLKRLDDVSFDA